MPKMRRRSVTSMIDARRGEQPPRNRAAQQLPVEQTVFPVVQQPHPGGGEEVEEVDPLRRARLDAEQQRHHQQEQRPAADAPRREHPRCRAREQGDPEAAHSRYLTPP